MIFARLGDKKQTRRQSMAEIKWGVSEIKCIILKENILMKSTIIILN
jgi:hypothetical protein